MDQGMIDIALAINMPVNISPKYWAEMYTNQPIVDPKRRHPYGDSPALRVFGNVSPRDPQLFSTINEFAAELLKGERYIAAPMEKQANLFRAAIPATYTESPYPLQYYFELRSGPDTSWLYPGFGAGLANQPYIAVRRAKTA
jgi:hypothetical protein